MDKENKFREDKKEVDEGTNPFDNQNKHDCVSWSDVDKLNRPRW